MVHLPLEAWEERSVPDLPKVFQDLEIDPYAGRTELIALTVSELAPQHEREVAGLQRHGEAIWRAAQRALIWWTPARTEQEALKRAADTPSPSVIAREVAFFTVLFEQYAMLAFETARQSGLPVVRDNFRFQVDLVRGTLEALERRAQAAESRATDYRLRYEFDKLRQVVAGRELASKITTLLEDAAKSTESIEHMRALVAEFQPSLERMQRDLFAVRIDVDYTAGCVMEESVRRMLPLERVKSRLAVLTDVVAAGTFLGEVLRSLARLAG